MKSLTLVVLVGMAVSVLAATAFIVVLSWQKRWGSISVDKEGMYHDDTPQGNGGGMLRHVAKILKDPRSVGSFPSALNSAEVAELRAVAAVIGHDVEEFDRARNHPEFPETRVFFSYLGYSESDGNMKNMADELFGFWTSWQWLVRGVYNMSEAFNIPTSDMPPLPRHSSTLQKAADQSSIRINDYLLVADPRMDLKYIPPGCEILYPLGHFDLPILEAHFDIDQRKKSGESKCFAIIVLLPNQFHPDFSSYLRLNSNNALIDATVQRLLLHYDLMVRSDNDAFLAPGMIVNRPPWKIKNAEMATFLTQQESHKDSYEFVFSDGGYSVTSSDQLRDEYRKAIGLRTAGQVNIGASFYGRPIDIIATARLANQIIRILLKNDPVFNLGSGNWPKWWRGTALMYSRELAVNHVIKARALKRIKFFLDFPSHTTANIFRDEKPIGTIHCWHTTTPTLFSKFAFKENKYKVEEIFPPSEFATANVTDVPIYSYVMAEIGRRVRQHRERLPQSDLPFANRKDEIVRSISEAPPDPEMHTGKIHPFISRQARDLQSTLFFCPEDYPYAFRYKHSDFKCCKENTDCDSKPLTKESTCCSGESCNCPINELIGCDDWPGTKKTPTSAASK